MPVPFDRIHPILGALEKDRFAATHAQDGLISAPWRLGKADEISVVESFQEARAIRFASRDAMLMQAGFSPGRRPRRYLRWATQFSNGVAS
jgi:hypothetical protein